jgi:hypothetical protein
MSVLGEAESLASYGRKRLALSHEKPTTPQRPKSHSPNEHNLTWDVQGAMRELENFHPPKKSTGLKWRDNIEYQKMRAKS